MTEVPDRVRRAFTDHGDFEQVAPDRFVTTSTPFDATVDVADEGGPVAFDVTVRVPMLSAVADGVALVEADTAVDCFDLETGERRFRSEAPADARVTATAAGEFAKWIASPEQQARWHKGTGYYPVHKDSIGMLEEEGWFEEQDGMRLAMDQLLDSEDTPATRGALIEDHGQVRDMLNSGAERMFDGDDVSTVLSEVKSDVDELLERSA